MLCAQAWKPSSQHAGEKRGLAGLLLGRTERAVVGVGPSVTSPRAQPCLVLSLQVPAQTSAPGATSSQLTMRSVIWLFFWPTFIFLKNQVIGKRKMSGMTPLLRAQQWPKTMSSWQCQKVVPSFQEPSRDLLSSMLLLTHSLPPHQLPDGPQTLWGQGAPLKALYLLFLLLFMFFPHLSTWLTLSPVPSPCINIFSLRSSLTIFLRPPKVPRHAGFPRGEHRGSRHRFL